jgi:hypothetical protein
MSTKQPHNFASRAFQKRFLRVASEFGFRRNYYYYTTYEGDTRFGIRPCMVTNGAFEFPILDVTCFIFSKTWFTVLHSEPVPEVGSDQISFELSSISGLRDGWFLKREDAVEEVTDQVIEAFRSSAMPLFHSCTTVESVLAYAEHGRSFNHGKKHLLEDIARYRELTGARSE